MKDTRLGGASKEEEDEEQKKNINVNRPEMHIVTKYSLPQAQKEGNNDKTHATYETTVSQTKNYNRKTALDLSGSTTAATEYRQKRWNKNNSEDTLKFQSYFLGKK